MKESFVFLANGFEEIEAVTPIDVMRRAGMKVHTVSITASHEVAGAHGVTFVADKTINEVDLANAEWIVLPGGLPGAQNLHQCEQLTQMLKKHSETGKIAAICASPAMVLSPIGLLNGKKATGYPGTEDMLTAGGAEIFVGRVAVDGNIVTSNGPSSSLKFALTIVSETFGQEKAKEIADGMLV